MWGSWGGCSQTCGGGSQQRRRNFKVHAQNGGTECVGPSLEKQTCSETKCPPG